MYSEWTLGSCCTCDIIIIKQLASLTGIKSTKQELFSRFVSSLVTRVDNDRTRWIDKTLWMPWQGHYLVTRHLGQKKQGRQVCGRCRDAGNLRCASGMQRCTDADVQGCGFWLFLVAILDFCANWFANWCSVLPWCSRFWCPGATLQSHKDYFCAFNSHLPCTPNINIYIYTTTIEMSQYCQAKSFCWWSLSI